VAPERTFADLVEIMARLRGPGGCPWDREQTHRTLRPYLLEEAYETLEAIDSGSAAALCQELGDLLLQVVFHAQMAAERGAFTIDDVIAGLVEKLIRRHPHVFADAQVAGASEVLANWEAIKAEERRTGLHTGAGSGGSGGPAGGTAPGEHGSALDGVPRALPSLALAQALQERAARAGFAWPGMADAVAKVAEELAELQEAARGQDGRRAEEEVGDLLFAAANLPRYVGADGEQALRDAAARFRARFERLEALARARGGTLADLPPAERLALWRSLR
jgi:MazG family protein